MDCVPFGRTLEKALAGNLGPTHPRSNAVDEEPFSAPVLGQGHSFLSRVLATTTKIFTEGGSSQAHAITFSAHLRAFLLVGAWRLFNLHFTTVIATDGRVSGVGSSAIHFQG